MPKKIVLVEDEQILQKVIAEFLELEGYKITAFSTGKEALAGIAKAEPDLILLDLILPEMSGLAVMRELNAKEATKNIPVIVLSNLGDDWSRNQALALGAKDYLVKAEHDLSVISKKIKNLLVE